MNKEKLSHIPALTGKTIVNVEVNKDSSNGYYGGSLGYSEGRVPAWAGSEDSDFVPLAQWKPITVDS
jgi:hypothetical protein